MCGLRFLALVLCLNITAAFQHSPSFPLPVTSGSRSSLCFRCTKMCELKSGPADGNANQKPASSELIKQIGAQAASRRAVRVSVSPAEMAEMAAMAAASSPEIAQNRQQKLALAIVSPLLAAAFFFGARMMPSDPVTILRSMESRSPKLEVALASGRPVLVEFYAQWCGDCKTMAPSMVELERKYEKEGIKFVVLDAERDENADLVNKFRVDAIHISHLSHQIELSKQRSLDFFRREL